MFDDPPRQSSRTAALRRGIMLGVVVVIGLIACWLRQSVDDNPAARDRIAVDESLPTPEMSTSAAEEVRVPSLTESPYLNTAASVRYVGSATCRECHQDEHRTFQLTSHSKSLTSMTEVNHPPDGHIQHPLSGHSYRVLADASTMSHVEQLLAEDGTESELATHPVAFQIGSGNHARSYLIEDDGFLIQSPVSWYENTQSWAMSPGYDEPQQPSFQRTIRKGCLYCHGGVLENPEENGFRHHLSERAIGCERCHGPGELHVQRQTADEPATPDSSVDLTIVNPADLPRSLQEDVCAQCHLSGDAAVAVRGKTAERYRPGLRLNEVRLEFREDLADPEMKVAGHTEQLRASACYQLSETLTCLSCHQLHADLSAAQQLQSFRNACLSCHGASDCNEELDVRELRGGDQCHQCHMPRSATEVTHVALTHHRIGIHSANSKTHPPASPTLLGLRSLQSLEHLSQLEQERAFGLARLTLIRQAGKDGQQMQQLQQTAELLKNVYEAGIGDATLFAALSGVARDFGKLDLAEQLASRALEDEQIGFEDRLIATDVLAEILTRTGRREAAYAALEQLATQTRRAFYWYLLAQARMEHGEDASALQAFKRAVQISPAAAHYREPYAELLERLGRSEEAAEQREWAQKLSKDDNAE